MKKHVLRILPLSAALLLSHCGGGAQQNPPPNLAPLPPPGPTPGLDPASGGGGGDAGGGAPPAPRAVQTDEFSISITVENDVRNLVSVPVHVVSTNSQNAKQLVAGGSPKYWQSPFRGSNVRNLQFGQKGSPGATVRAPSVPRMDAVVLVADLAAPTSGNDFRILEIPLELDYSDPAAPVAHPISVRLTRNGWQRER